MPAAVLAAAATMSRRKQVVPKRRADAAQPESEYFHGFYDVDEGINPQHVQQEPPPARTAKKHRISHYCAEEPSTLELPHQEGVYAFAEFIVATRRRDAGGSPAEAVADSTAQELTVRVIPRLLNDCGGDDEDVAGGNTAGITLTWSVGDEAGSQHKVLFQVPSGCLQSILRMLQQQQLQLSCAQLPTSQWHLITRQQRPIQHRQQQPHPQGEMNCIDRHEQQYQQRAPVQYVTQEVSRRILRDYQCDVVATPDHSAVREAILQCEAAASAAAAPQQGSCIQQPFNTVLLPAQHVALMAAAAAADNNQQEQQNSSGHSPADGAAADASDGLLLWRIRFGLSQQLLSQDTSWHAQLPEQTPHASAPVSGLLDLFQWLVPHWVPNHSLSKQRLFGFGSSAVTDKGKEFDAADLYSAVKPQGDEPMLLSTPPELLPTLRPYQRRAVAWMLGRENAQQQHHPHWDMAAGKDAPAAASSAGNLHTELVQQQLHPAWRCGMLLPTTTAEDRSSTAAPTSTSSSCAAVEPADAYVSSTPTLTGICTAAGSTGSSELQAPVIYFSPVTGLLSVEPFPPPQFSGGILADEMGLGKTVELLALISTNRFTPKEELLDPATTTAANAAAGNTAVPAAVSNSVARVSHNSNCCCRCGELFESGYYTRSGWVPGPRPSRGADSDSPCVSDDDLHHDDDYTPGRRRAQKQSPKAKKKTTGFAVAKSRGRHQQQQDQQQVGQLHGVWHRGAKRHRLCNSRSTADPLQQKQDQDGISGSSKPASNQKSTLVPIPAVQHADGHEPQELLVDAFAQGLQGMVADPNAPPDAADAALAPAGSSRGLVCSACLREIALQEVHEACGTTLIVVPSNILVQWVDELMKHIKPGTLSLKVYVGQYQPGAAAPAAPLPPGRRKRAAAGSDVRSTAAKAAGGGAAAAATAAGQVVTAAELAATDVVVTTYDVLKRELALQPGEEGSDRSLRRKKRYAVVPTPLSRLRFWRLVLDEAQLVQGSTAKAAEMTRLVQATHRWAVTGTPISRGAEDLLGTLSCLQAQPWAGSSWWWKKAIADPLATGGPDGWTTLLRVMCPRLGGVLWRSAKADVLSEMGLPPQAQHTTLLRLSAIERHWYIRAHQDCAAKARKVLQDAITQDILHRRGAPASNSAAATAAKAAAASAASAAIAAGGDGRELDAASATVLGPLLDRQLLAAEQKKLLVPLLRLRQACLHPQVGAAGLRSALTAGGGSSNSSTPLTMDQILIVLTTKARTEAEESQRQLIGALNGLAALMRLNGDCAAAVATYRQGLATAEAQKQEVRTDPLQLLHTLHNLHDLLQHLASRYTADNPTAGLAGSSSSSHAPYGPAVPRTLRDDTLASEAAALQNSYLTQRFTELQAASGAYLRSLKEAVSHPHHRGLGLRQHSNRRTGRAGAIRLKAGGKGGVAGGSSAGQPAAGTAGASSSGSSAWQQAMMGEGEDDDLSWLDNDDDDIDDPADDGDVDDNDELHPAAAAGGSGLAAGWYLSVIDMLQSQDLGIEVAEHIREKLQEADTYRQKVAQNATSIVNRFDTLHGLKLLISQELSALDSHQAAALHQLEQLQLRCTEAEGPQDAFIEQAGQCGRCRAETGVVGLVCQHCRLDEQMRKWEIRLFSLHTRALVAGTQIDAEAAAAQAQQAALRRVGQGGLNEAAGEQDTAAAGAGAGSSSGRRQGTTAVSETQIVRHPSEVERVLRILHQQINRHGLSWHLPAGVSESSSAHLERLEASRQLFTAAGALSVAQRQLLYAHDELAMAVLRIETRMEGEQVSAHEAVFRLTEPEQVIKNSELSLERVLAESELKRALGKLRYLNTIAAARRRAAAAGRSFDSVAGSDGTAIAAASAQFKGEPQQQQQQQQQQGLSGTADKLSPRAAAAAAALQRASAAGTGDAAAADAGRIAVPLDHHHQQQQGTGTAAAPGADIPQDNCPICHDKVEAAAAVLPCGHILCCSCADGLAARIPAALPQTQRRVTCPTCRARTHVSDVAYVDSGRSSTYAYVSTASAVPAAGDGLAALGSPRRRSGEGASSSSSSYPWQGEQQLVVSGSYGTKIEALVRRLLYVLQDAAAAKAIVFSSWQDGLDIVSHALKANGVAHAYGRGRKGFLWALEQFKGTAVDEAQALGAAAAQWDKQAAEAAADQNGSPGRPAGNLVNQHQPQQEATPAGLASSITTEIESSEVKYTPTNAADNHAVHKPSIGSTGRSSQVPVGPRVLLLLVNQGAAGLNLTEAEHVVLLEPLLDPAQELQAMGRVNRFGQTKTTHVHRFVIEHTIEENVAAVCHQRATAMDMSAAVPIRRSSSSGGGGSSGGDDAADLTVRDVAALLSTKWREGCEGEEGGQQPLDMTVDH